MDVTSELLSRYVDGELTPAESEAVEAAVADDPTLAAQVEDLRVLDELFGGVEPEDVSDELKSRLYGLRPVEELEAFEVVAPTPVRRIPWPSWVAAAAAVALVVFGLSTLTHRPEVVLRDFARLSVNADGEAEDVVRSKEVTRRAGDTLRAGKGERVSFRTPDGALVVVLPGGAVEVGDPRDGVIFELARGTVLASVPHQDEPRAVRAAGYTVYLEQAADFGVRLEGLDVKPAGPAGGRRAAVTVTVSRGSVEVAQNGDRETVQAYQRVVLRSGEPVRRSHAADDPIYRVLMGHVFRPRVRELLPGYFDSEKGVTAIPARRWARRADGTRVLVLTDAGSDSLHSTHLVLYVRASMPGPLHLTRVRPRGGREAEAVTVKTPSVGKEWTVIAIPHRAFGEAGAVHETRQIPAGRNQLVRLELRAANPDTIFELRSSLWAARAPSESREVSR